MRLRPLILVACAAAFAAGPKTTLRQIRVDVPMRDGVRLSANVFRPTAPARVPAILYRTPYGKGADITPNYQAFVDHGYAVVVQDVRGRYDSEGTFRPLEQEGRDGYDTIEWIARQPWSDGRVGMTGGSYLGIAQWKAALLNNPHLKAIFPWVSGSDDYRDRFYSPGGALKLGGRLLWMNENLRLPGYRADFAKYVLHLPLRTADRSATGQASEMYQAALRHPAYDGFWRSMSTREQSAKIKIPAFVVGGWYDNFVESDLEGFAALHRRSGVHRLMIGPWAHDMRMKFAEADFGPDAIVRVTRGAVPVVRSVAEGQGYAAALRGARAHLRHGREPLARGARVAADPRAAHPLLPREQRPSEYVARQRGPRCAPAASGAARPLRLRPAQPRSHARRRRLLQPEDFSRGDPWTSASSRAATTSWSTLGRR